MWCQERNLGVKEVAKFGTYVIMKDGMRIILIRVHFHSGVGLLCECMFIFLLLVQVFYESGKGEGKGKWVIYDPWSK